MKTRSIAAALAAVSLFGAAHAQTSAFDDASTNGAQVAKPTFEFAKVRSKVQPNDPVGHFRTGFFCGTDSESRASATIENVANYNVQAAFKIVTRELNVPLFERELSPFETATPKSADFRIGGVLQRINYDTCNDGLKRKGSAQIEMKWEVYSTKLQQVVLSKTVTSEFKTEDYMPNSLFEAKAYTSAMRTLLVSDEFKALETGKLPEGAVAWPTLHLKAGPAAIEGNAPAKADALAKAVVTIISDGGSGTGFYIADGYVLTDRHVVGSQKYVKVKLSNGKQLVGEVIRQNAARDVALLQTESAGTPALRVAPNDPPVGAPMYAIGSPLGETLSGTFTQGVLSGVRDFNGTRYLQSDVSINHGNSGGPLLDANSHVVGLADLTINQTTGLSFFVPMKDALTRLAIVVDDAAQ